MNESTLDEFLENYGNVEVVFVEYWKYVFSFKGRLGLREINVSVGGDGGDVYRFEVVANKKYTVAELHTQAGIHSGYCINDNGERTSMYRN